MHAGTYKPCDNVMDARKQRAQLPLRKLVTRIYGAAGAASRSSPVWKHAVKNRQRSASHPSDECFDLRRCATGFFFVVPMLLPCVICRPPMSCVKQTSVGCCRCRAMTLKRSYRFRPTESRRVLWKHPRRRESGEEPKRIVL